MSLPSNVAKFQGLSDIPDFDQLEPRFVFPPQASRLRAWVKLQELERRLDHFEWLLHIARPPNSLPKAINDSAIAFVMTFESVIQLLKKEFRPTVRFDAWLHLQSSYDLTCRGFQTMRNLDAHVRSGSMTGKWSEHGSSRFAAASDPGTTIAWHFAPISDIDYGELLVVGRKLSSVELPLWNAQADEHLAEHLMRCGIQSLVSLLNAAQ